MIGLINGTAPMLRRHLPLSNRRELRKLSDDAETTPPAPPMIYRTVGKAVYFGAALIADAATPGDAALIVEALNAYEKEQSI